MTVGRAFSGRVADMVRGLATRFRTPRLTVHEAALAVHLRGNVALYDSLTTFIRARIESRLALPEPDDPLTCKSILARTDELRWVLARLEYVHRSPINPEAESELPVE